MPTRRRHTKALSAAPPQVAPPAEPRPLAPAWSGAKRLGRQSPARCPLCVDSVAAVYDREDGARLCSGCGHVWRTRRPMEDDIQAGLRQILGAREDVRIWRQNTGTLFDGTGRPVSYGLEGAGDLSGIVAIAVPSRLPHPPLPIGIRLEVEVKRPRWKDDTGKVYPAGRPSPAQLAFGEMVHRQGGFYILTDTVENGVAQLDRMIADVRRHFWTVEGVAR
jgi:hypothetical protein